MSVLEQTSLLAYSEAGFRDSLRSRVFRLLSSSPGGLTANEVSVLLGVKISSITGRLHELRARGLIQKGSVRPDRFTNFKSHTWVVR